MHKKNTLPFQESRALLKRKRQLSPLVSSFTLDLRGSKMPFIPGQFALLEVPGHGEFAAGMASDPLTPGTLEFTVKKVGVATSGLHGSPLGADIFIRGPLGNGFREALGHTGDLVMLCGGTGIPPIRSLVKSIERGGRNLRKVTLLIGARSPEELLYRHEYANWSRFMNVVPIVEHGDDEWTGTCGLIPLLIKKLAAEKDPVAVMVGPPAMYSACLIELMEKDFRPENIFVSLERNMKCGIGKCQHCVEGCNYVCLDGPVFSYARIKAEMPDALK